MWFSSNRGGNGFMTYLTTRASLADPWGVPGLFAVGTAGISDDPYITADLLTMWFDDNPGTSSSGSIFETGRATPTDAFGAAFEHGDLDGGSVESDPALTADQLTIVFDSQRDADVDLDLYAGTRSTTGDSFTVAKLAGLSMTGIDCCAVFAAGDTQVVYATQHGEAGAQRELYVTSFDGTSFGTGALLDANLGSDNGDDTDPAFTADGTHILFASTRSASAFHLYEAVRGCD